MKLVKLNKLFDSTYGTNHELNALEVVDEIDDNSVNFVSRTSKNNGVSAIVRKIDGVDPIPENTISVAGGGSVLEAFLQRKPYYSGRDLYYLKPKVVLTEKELLFYCYCIRKNKFKYSFGRQANRTLNELLLPDTNEMPKWIKNIKYQSILDLPTEEFVLHRKRINNYKTRYVELAKVFEPRNGLASSQVKREGSKKSDNFVPYIRPSKTQETSIDGYVNKNLVPSKYIFPIFSLYVSTDGQGSHTYSYVSTSEFVPNSNVTVLIPRREMSIQELVYYSLIISKNRFKFSYGRKPKGDRLKILLIPKYPSLNVCKRNYIREIIESIGNG
jgi:hypothetical protein